MQRVMQSAYRRGRPVMMFLALALLLCFFVISISTMLFIATNVNHACCGVDCVTCVRIDYAARILGQIVKVAVIVSCMGAGLFFAPSDSKGADSYIVFPTALICTNSRMNN